MDYGLSATLELKDKFSVNIKNARYNLNNFTTSVEKNTDKVGGLASKLKGLGENFGGLTKGIMAGAAAFWGFFFQKNPPQRGGLFFFYILDFIRLKPGYVFWFISIY